MTANDWTELCSFLHQTSITGRTEVRNNNIGHWRVGKTLPAWIPLPAVSLWLCDSMHPSHRVKTLQSGSNVMVLITLARYSLSPFISNIWIIILIMPASVREFAAGVVLTTFWVHVPINWHCSEVRLSEKQYYEKCDSYCMKPSATA